MDTDQVGRQWRRAAAMAAFVAFAAFPAIARANLIQDGGFENATPVFYFPGPIGDGWTVTKGSIGIIANGSAGVGRPQRQPIRRSQFWLRQQRLEPEPSAPRPDNPMP